MPQSAFNRLWNTVKLPSASRPESPQVVARRRSQRRLIMATVAVIVLIAVGIAAFSYISSAPARADQEFQAGMKLMSPGKYPDAIAHFTKALQIYGQLPDAYLERGNAHKVLGEPDLALADFQAAINLNPVLASAYNGMAMIYVERHDLKHALEGFNKSISYQPTVEAYYQRGQILEGQGEHQKAIADYDSAIREMPEAPFMYRARALSKANLGDAEGAHADRLIATKIENH